MALMQLGPWSGANNEAATTENTGYNSRIFTDPGSSSVFKDTWRPRDLNSILVTTSTSAGYALFTLTLPAPSDAIAFEEPILPVKIPTAEQQLVSFHNASDGHVFRIACMADGSLLVRNGSSANAYRSAAGVFAPNVPVILSIFFTRHPSTGTFHVVVYNEDGSVRADSTLRTGQNTGSATVNHVKATMAKGFSSSTVDPTYYLGVPRYDFQATGLLPLWTPPATHSPMKMLINGQLTPVKARLGNGTSTGIPIL